MRFVQCSTSYLYPFLLALHLSLWRSSFSSSNSPQQGPPPNPWVPGPPDSPPPPAASPLPPPSPPPHQQDQQQQQWSQGPPPGPPPAYSQPPAGQAPSSLGPPPAYSQPPADQDPSSLGPPPPPQQAAYDAPPPASFQDPNPYAGGAPPPDYHQGGGPPPPQYGHAQPPVHDPGYGGGGGGGGAAGPPSPRYPPRHVAPLGHAPQHHPAYPPAAEGGLLPPDLDPTQRNKTFGGQDLSNLDKEAVFEGLKKLYEKKVKPLEVSSRYDMFRSPPMTPSDFTAKPMVLIIGQYSVGKTSFIRGLVGKDFPGQRVGPEPTTDRFTAIMHGREEKLLPGHVLVNSDEYPFKGLDTYGNNFLSKMEGAVVDSPILRNVTLIDTPGVLSGEKQRVGRDYDFSSVVSWFAERADMIIVMFDAHKLDISDELKSALDILKPHHDKMRILLNKADSIDTQQLMRVYGALMWSLGKVMMTPEVFRVYMGSFWEGPCRPVEQAALLEREKADLIAELVNLPENAVVRRINELVKRARAVKVHAYIIHYLRKQVPYMYYNRKEKQQKLIMRLPQQFRESAARYSLSLGDYPPVPLYQERLRDVKDIFKFEKLDKKLVYEMEKVFTDHIPKLLKDCTMASPVPEESSSGFGIGGRWR